MFLHFAFIGDGDVDLTAHIGELGIREEIAQDMFQTKLIAQHLQRNIRRDAVMDADLLAFILSSNGS
jgi:hypothetical protein